MNKKLTGIAMSLLIALCLLCSGCNSLFSNGDRSPISVIQDAYGNEEFSISFYSEGLDVPLSDMAYTARSIPKLPTPTRVGYIFEGWYLDQNFTVPYSDQILYLYMTDVMLHAKWSREEFVQEGVYEIEYEAHILEETLSSADFDSTGNYKDFTEALIADEIYIEKTSEALMLRLQYDCGEVAGIGENDVFTVRTAGAYGTVLPVQSEVNSSSDPVKTIYYNIENYDIAAPFYFEVVVDNRDSTVSSYVIEFNITRLIGFTQSFVNPDLGMESGYYLVNTYYIDAEGNEAMGGDYNSVFSYLIVDGEGNITLIKPSVPYTGMVGSGANTDYYYDRDTAFIPMSFCYGSETDEYSPVTVEYHADTGRMYYVFEIGKTVKQDLYVNYAVTGFMEMMFNYGARTIQMDIDYTHITRLSSLDYVPLQGDAYKYRTETVDYGNNSPDRNRNMYSAMQEYGMTTPMINFFYTAPSADAELSERTMFSHRITYTPLDADEPASQLTYSTVHYDTEIYVYGYGGTGNLYYDSLTVSNDRNIGLRETAQIKTGKSFLAGDMVNAEDIYRENVDMDGSLSDAGLTWNIYAMNAGEVDYSVPLAKREQFGFESSVAIVFEKTTSAGVEKTIVELAEYEEPNISFEENNGIVYDPNGENVYNYGESIPVPVLTYSWMGSEYNFRGSFYGDVIMEPLRIKFFEVETDGSYSYYPMSTKDLIDCSVSMSYDKLAVIYELRNIYGEKYYYEVIFTVGNPAVPYEILRGEESILSGTLSYKDGVLGVLDASQSYYTVLQTENELNTVLVDNLTFLRGETSEDMPLVSVQYGGTRYTVDGNATEVLSQLRDYLLQNPGKCFSMQYATERGDSYLLYYSWQMTFDGEHTFEPVKYDNMFTGVTYTLRMPHLVTIDGEFIAAGRSMYVSSVSGLNNYQFTDLGNGIYSVTFRSTGVYAITYSPGYISGTTFLNISFVWYVEVMDGEGEASITFVATDGTSFSEDLDPDGDGRYTITVDLTSNYTLPSSNIFADRGGKTLYGWSLTEGELNSDLRAGYTIRDLISMFNSQNIVLYAVWS